MAIVTWPESLAGTPAVAVIERALKRNRLAHSLLLHGDDFDTLVVVARGIADRLLNEDAERPIPPDQHPDCFALRPAGRARQITADATRALIGRIQVSPAVGPRKVALVFEADRMNAAAANIFLKTLEEPPGLTTLLLLTSRPYALLPTIRSRCLHFRFAAPAAEALAGLGEPVRQAWGRWESDYHAWLAKLTGGVSERKEVAAQIFGLYGLVARFDFILDRAAQEVWKTERENLPAELDEEEQVAAETGVARGIRQRLFADVERATFAFARTRLEAGDAAVRPALTGAIRELERCGALLRVNLSDSAALEQFLLASLRLWSRRTA